MDIGKLLGVLGVNEQEADVYLALFDSDERMSANEIGKVLNIPRTTVYGLVESLYTRGLVEKSEVGRGTVFLAKDPREVLDLFDQSIAEINQAKNDFSTFAASSSRTRPYVPKFQDYESVGESREIFNEILRERDCEVLWFWSENGEFQFHHEFQAFEEERKKRMITFRVLYYGEYFDPNHFLRSSELSSSRSVSVDLGHQQRYVIFGSKVLFFSARHEYFAYSVDSKEFSASMANVFDHLWEVSQ